MHKWRKFKFNEEVPALAGHTLTRVGDKAYVFGGVDENGKKSNRFFAFDMNGDIDNIESINTPSPRDGHLMVSVDNGLILYGGRDESIIYKIMLINRW